MLLQVKKAVILTPKIFVQNVDCQSKNTAALSATLKLHSVSLYIVATMFFIFVILYYCAIIITVIIIIIL